MVTLLVFILTGCGQAAEDSPAQAATPSSACDSAFAEAADVDEFQDTVSNLYPAGRDCSGLEDWKLGASANPGAIAEGVDPVVFAYNMCTNAPAEVQSSNVCKEAVAADPMGIEKFAE